MIDISVIICTHNPRWEWLQRVLNALKVQTLPKDRWELVLVDNASERSLAAEVDLVWHPNGRVVREEGLGLTPARLRGIHESTGRLLFFVDDDNVLEPDYLAEAKALEEGFPQMGAWCGSIRGEFEVAVPEWFKPHLDRIAVREIERDYWSNVGDYDQTMPCGAGLCVRRSVTTEYVGRCRTDPRRKELDRKGASLVSGGDQDLALCAVDLGFGVGRFTRLRLTHLIPACRLSADYLVELTAAQAYSYVLLTGLRHSSRQQHLQSALWNRLAFWVRLMRLPEVERRIALASRQAQRDAKRALARGALGNMR